MDRGDGVVVLRIDFALAGGGVERGGLSLGGGLSDHLAIGCMVYIDDLEMVEGSRDAVDWAKVQLTVADEREVWYEELVGDTAYDKLVDLGRRHLKKIRVSGRSKRRWDADLTAQVRNVPRERKRVSYVCHPNVLRSEISHMRRMGRDQKEKC